MHAQRNMVSWVRLDQNHKVGRDTTVRVGRHRTTNIKKNENLTVETGDETHEVKSGSRQTKINKADQTTVETGDSTTDVKQGNYTVKVDMGKVLIDAMQEIQLKVGSNTLKLSPTGLEVNAMTVKINSNTTWSAQGLQIQLQGSAQVSINGAMVMIN
jgi:type VI secretion system secreted protein VgrG